MCALVCAVIVPIVPGKIKVCRMHTHMLIVQYRANIFHIRWERRLNASVLIIMPSYCCELL